VVVDLTCGTWFSESLADGPRVDGYASHGYISLSPWFSALILPVSAYFHTMLK